MIRLTALLLTLSACGTQDHLPTEAPADKCEAGAFPEGPVVVDVKMPSRTRQALVWIPHDVSGPMDVVVDFHEFRSNPMRQAHYSTWVAAADELDVILVAPDGKSSTWNAGPCCGKAQEKGIDDVAFLNALMERIDEVTCTSGRVMATGIGNGAMMASRWACESDVVDGLVTVGGSLQTETCERTSPLPVLHYHGTKDTFIPRDGGAGVVGTTLPEGHRPVSHAISQWRKVNGVPNADLHLKRELEPDDLPVEIFSEGDLNCRSYKGEAPLTDCMVTGMPDFWPGAEDAPVNSASPLADAARGGFGYVKAYWDAPAEEAAVAEEATGEAAPEEAAEAPAAEEAAEAPAPEQAAEPATP